MAACHITFSWLLVNNEIVQPLGLTFVVLELSKCRVMFRKQNPKQGFPKALSFVSLTHTAPTFIQKANALQKHTLIINNLWACWQIHFKVAFWVACKLRFRGYQ